MKQQRANPLMEFAFLFVPLPFPRSFSLSICPASPESALEIPPPIR